MNYVVSNSSSATSAASGYSIETDLEAITVKIIELGVDLRRGRLIKDVLLHLRPALQAVHSVAFEFALRQLLKAAEDRLMAAQAKLITQDLTSLDLDEEFSSFSAAGAEDRDLVTPWLRFYWEVLRVCLDISRNNNRLELVYHDAVMKAFSFCRQYSRKSEFRRMSEMVRYHLALTVRYPSQLNAVQLTTSSESYNLALELRFCQLALATDLELWQEAFRTVEDIYGLQLLAKKSIRQVTAPEYFDKLAKIFSKSNNFLFLAATLLRQPQLKPDQVETVVMATLAIVDDNDRTQSERLAQIIGLSTVPTRASLLATIESRSMITKVSEPVKNIYAAMSSKSVESCLQGVAALETVSESLKPFIAGCYENLFRNLVQEISKSRDSIQLNELRTLAGANESIRKILPKFNFEMFILLGIRNESFRGLKIDHMSGSLKIDRSIYLSNPIGVTWSQLHDEMYKKVHQPSFTPVTGLLSALKKEHEANLDRRGLIEKRKEILEAAAAEKEAQDMRERALKAQKEAETERLRQAEDIARRDRERLERERAEIRKSEAEKRLAEQEKLKEAAGARLNREKIAAQAVRFDYLERALRAEEISLLQNDYQKQKETDRAAYETKCQLIVDLAKNKFARDLELKKKITESSEISNDYSEFMKRVKERRQREFEIKSEEAQAELEREKVKRVERIAAEVEARKKLEIERQAARNAMLSMAAAAASSSAPLPEAQSQSLASAIESVISISPDAPTAGKYVPPARQSAWRRSETVPVAAPQAEQEKESAPVPSAPAPVAAAPVVEAEKPKENVYVPRHKRTTN